MFSAVLTRGVMVEMLQSLWALCILGFCVVIREVIRQADCSKHQLHFIRLMAAEGPWHEFKGNVMTWMLPGPSVSLPVSLSYSNSFYFVMIFLFLLNVSFSLSLLSTSNICISQSVCVWMHHASCLAVEDRNLIPSIPFTELVFLQNKCLSVVSRFGPVALWDKTCFNTNEKLLQCSFNLITIHCAVKQAFVNWKQSMYNIHLWKQTRRAESQPTFSKRC